MRTRAFIPLIAHVGTCVVLGCVFLFYGASEVVRFGKIGPIAPFHTTDKYLDFLINDSSEHLLKAFTRLSEDEPVEVVYSETSDSATLLAYLVAYFSWPRPVKSLQIEHCGFHCQSQTAQAEHVSAVFFCGIDPPPSVPFDSIGQGLVMLKRPPLKR